MSIRSGQYGAGSVKFEDQAWLPAFLRDSVTDIFALLPRHCPTICSSGSMFTHAAYGDWLHNVVDFSSGWALLDIFSGSLPRLAAQCV